MSTRGFTAGMWLAVALVLPACRPAPAADEDRGPVEQTLTRYLESVRTADPAIAADVWLQSPEVAAVTPLGRFQGWESVRNDLYVNFLQKAFTTRKLEASHIVLRVNGNAAWAVFDWTFTSTLANGQPFSSKGWETHVYRKTERGWRIEHLHYSAPPPPQPPPPAQK